MLAVILAVGMLMPLTQLVWRAFEDGIEPFWAIVLRPRTALLLGNTIALIFVVGAGCFLLGVATAWIVVRTRIPAPRFWWVLAALPLAVPSYVTAFALLASWPGSNGFWPLVAVLILTSVPLVTIPTMGALVMADHSLTDVARTLGRSGWHAFITVTMPQILPAALAGTLLALLYTMSDFGAPAMLRYETLTTGVYALFTSGFDRTAATATSLVLALLAIICIVGEARLRGINRAQQQSAQVRRGSKVSLSRKVRIGVVLFLSSIAAISIAFPLGVLVWRMIQGARFLSEFSRLMEASFTTFALGVTAATFAILLALPISFLAARYRSRFIQFLESVNFIGNAFPGVVLALALVAISLALLPGLYQTLAILIAAYVILFVSKSIGSTRTAIEQISPRAEDASRTLGRNAFSTWISVTLRGSLPGIAAGWLLIVIAVMKELPATLMLRPIGIETLATELWSKTTIGAYGSAAPIGLLLILLGVIPAWWMSRSIKRA